MFDRIAPRYDVLNRLLSFRRDVAWRRSMARFLPEREGLDLLDLATGTGDQLLSLLDHSKRIKRVTGVDMAERMLDIGRDKIKARGLQDRVQMRTGDATAIPAADANFDVVTISFGIRNVVDTSRGLAEIYRVLRPGGRALVLEFSTPENPLFRPIYLLYLRHILPLVGGILSGDIKAYKYLNRTIETFPSGDAFCALMRQAGFQATRANPLSLGIATIYQGDKP